VPPDTHLWKATIFK